MRRSLLAAVGMCVLATAAFAAPAKPHESWGTGVIERIDPAARSLVVKQGAHEMTFVVASTAQLVEGKSTLTFDDLSKTVGHQAKVRYRMDNGTRTADRVEVSTASKASATSATRPAPKTHPGK